MKNQNKMKKAAYKTIVASLAATTILPTVAPLQALAEETDEQNVSEELKLVNELDSLFTQEQEESINFILENTNTELEDLLVEILYYSNIDEFEFIIEKYDDISSEDDFKEKVMSLGDLANVIAKEYPELMNYINSESFSLIEVEDINSVDEYEDINQPADETVKQETEDTDEEAIDSEDTKEDLEVSQEEEDLEDTTDDTKEERTEDETDQDDANTNQEFSTFSATIQSESFESADEFYENVVNAPNASTAWDRAMAFKDAYPNDARLSEAINDAAERILTLGQNAHRVGNFSTALGYYNNLINEEHLNDDLSNALNSLYERVNNQESINYASTYYNNTINASNATAAWNNVQLFVETYPNDNRINAALDSAGSRILSMGQSSHRSANYSRAQYYYELIIDEPLLVGTPIYVEAELFNNQASNNNSLTTSDDLFSAVMNASNATNAWNAAQDFKAQFPNDSRLNEALNSAGNRNFSMGQSSHRNGNYSRARYYYELIIDESELAGSQMYREAEILHTQALNNEEMNLPTDMFNAVINASNATNAWNAAQDFKAQFPNDTRVSEALSSAGNRVFSMGRSNANKENYNTALTYFNWLKDETDLESSLRNQAIDYIESIETRAEADRYFNNVINASNATNAWNAAQDFKAQFPNDNRLSEAMDSAAQRIYSMGRSNHRNGNYSAALTYYNQLEKESLVNSDMANTVGKLIPMAEQNIRLYTATNYTRRSQNASTATDAWNIAVEGLNIYPTNSQLISALNSAANRQFSMGQSSHRNRNYSLALSYYNRVLSHESVDSQLTQVVNIFKKQADNQRPLMTASNYKQESQNASFASDAWDIALEGMIAYPSDSGIQEALNDAANRSLKLGRSYQNSGNNSSARTYYNKVINETMVNSSIRHLASIFSQQLTPNYKPTVYIDPGHGGNDSGASHSGVHEKTLNMNTANYLKNELESRGYIVKMSRSSDVFIDLTPRADEANGIDADIFISIHYNSMGGNGTARGIETFIHHTLQNAARFGQETNRNNFKMDDPRIDESVKLADGIHNKLISSTGMRDRGVKGNNFNVLRNTDIPAVLLELGFMDNSSELSRIRTSNYQRTAARAVADGVDAYFGK